MIEKPCILCWSNAEHLHPLVKLDKNSINQDILKQDCSSNIFEQIASTNKPIKKLVKELLIFKRY